MNNLDKQYLDLLRDIKDNGTRKETRNGVTYSIFGRTIRHDMTEGFPLLTTKKMWWHGIVTELKWFLSGNTNIQWLLERGNTIWVGDAYKHYIEERPEDYYDDTLTKKQFIERIKEDDEFAEEWGDMGRIYPAQWRSWRKGYKGLGEYETIDQIQNLIDDLWEKPDSRRIRVSAWNVAELDDMKLPPCHYGFQVWTRELTDDEKEKYNRERGISLCWDQRSVDTPLGLPFNIASYGLLLKMISSEVNMIPLELIGHLKDTHIYENQMEGVEKQLQREGHSLPEVQVPDGIYSCINELKLLNYESEEKIDFPLSN